MPIGNGEDVNATNSNRAFLDREADDTALGIIALANTDPASGATIPNLQAAVNASGADVGGTVYSSNNVITNGDDHATVLGDLDERFGVSGHNHSGVAGEGPSLDENALPNSGFIGRWTKAGDLLATTGTSVAVTSELSAKSPSLNDTTLGVVANASDNIIPLRHAAADSDFGTPIDDGSGGEVFGRLTESAGVWTLSFVSRDGSGSEVAHNFLSSIDIQWWYQELFHPVNSTQAYDETAQMLIGRAAETGTRKGVDALSDAQDTHTITFSTPIENTSYEVQMSIENSVDGTPIIFPGLTITAKTVNGFTFELSAPTDSVNYKVNYRAQLLVLPATAINVRIGSDSLSSGQDTHTITFSTVLTSTSYEVKLSIVNETDPTPQIIPGYTITSKTTAGFTFITPTSLDSANYKADYRAELL